MNSSLIHTYFTYNNLADVFIQKSIIISEYLSELLYEGLITIVQDP